MVTAEAAAPENGQESSDYAPTPAPKLPKAKAKGKASASKARAKPKPKAKVKAAGVVPEGLFLLWLFQTASPSAV